MNLSQAQAAIDQAIATLTAAKADLIPDPPPPPPPPPPTKLARVADWLGADHIGIYYGVYSSPWRAPQFAAAAKTMRGYGADYLLVKFGEYGIEWYDGTVAAIKQAINDAGMGLAPYYFCRPQTASQDAAICGRLAEACGGIVLDAEESFLNEGSALHTIVQGVRNAAPTAVIIVTGYGDPTYAFGTRWPFDAIGAADAYQPQIYLGVWDIYHQKGWQAAIDWAMQQCSSELDRCHLGQQFPIQPAINLEHVALGDLAPIAAYLKRWGSSIAIWEASQANAEIIGELRKGLGQ